SAHEVSWTSAKHRRDWRTTLTLYAYPVFGDLPVAAIDTGLVIKALEPIWNVKTETATRVRERVERVLDWAKARGIRNGENPARWRGHLDHLLPARSKMQRERHHAALPYNEAGEFMAALRQSNALGARALEFTVLTAARIGEGLGMRWEEVDLEIGRAHL